MHGENRWWFPTITTMIFVCDIKTVIRRLNKDRQDIGRTKMDKQRSAKHYTLK